MNRSTRNFIKFSSLFILDEPRHPSIFMLFIWHHGVKLKWIVRNIFFNYDQKQWLHVFNIHLSTIKKERRRRDASSSTLSLLSFLRESLKLLFFYISFFTIILSTSAAVAAAVWLISITLMTIHTVYEIWKLLWRYIWGCKKKHTHN